MIILVFFFTFLKDIKYIFCTGLYKNLLYSSTVNPMRNIHLWYITIHYFIRSVQQEVVFFVQYQISYFFRIVQCHIICIVQPYCTVLYFFSYCTTRSYHFSILYSCYKGNNSCFLLSSANINKAKPFFLGDVRNLKWRWKLWCCVNQLDYNV